MKDVGTDVSVHAKRSYRQVRRNDMDESFCLSSFNDKEAQKVYNQELSEKVPGSIQRIALRKLMILNNVEALEDLKIPPANRLEVLKGDRLGQYSIRVNDQFRICFEYRNGDFYNVEITDHH